MITIHHEPFLGIPAHAGLTVFMPRGSRVQSVSPLATCRWSHLMAVHVLPLAPKEKTMTDLKITYTETETKGRYAATQDGMEGEAELTTSKVSPTLIIADHTAVPDSMRGRGVGRALADRLIADARSKGQRIVPLCPFVRAHAVRHREKLADVIQW